MLSRMLLLVLVLVVEVVVVEVVVMVVTRKPKLVKLGTASALSLLPPNFLFLLGMW